MRGTDAVCLSFSRRLALLGLLGDSLGRGLITVSGLLSSAALMDVSSPGLRAATGDFTVWSGLDLCEFLGVLTVFSARPEDLALGESLDFSLMEAARLSSSVSALDFTGDFPAPPIVRG